MQNKTKQNLSRPKKNSKTLDSEKQQVILEKSWNVE